MHAATSPRADDRRVDHARRLRRHQLRRRRLDLGLEGNATTSNKPAVATAAERPYVDAMVASAVASDGNAELTATIAKCISTAIVHG